MDAMTAVIDNDTGAVVPVNDGAFEAWRASVAALAEQARSLPWQVGDLVRQGVEQFGKQAELALGDLTEEPKKLLHLGKVAAAFPAGRRSPRLQIAHYAEVMGLTEHEQSQLLNEALHKRLPVSKLRGRVIEHRARTGQYALPSPQEDPDHHEACSIAVQWNRAGRAARQIFIEAAREADLGVVEL